MGSYGEVYEYLERLLDKGIIEPNLNPNFCCPDCVNSNDEGTTYKVYVLASAETYLNFANFLGCIQAPAAVPAIGYGASSSSKNCGCCLQFIGSIETMLGLNADGVINNSVDVTCPNNFTSCKDLLIDSLLEFEGIEAVDRILDKGIVEYNSLSGSSQICKIYEFINQIFELEPFATLTRSDILDRILDRGIVISCYNDEIQFGSVETWYKWAEASGIIVFPA